jgi:hypothetical protein
VTAPTSVSLPRSSESSLRPAQVPLEPSHTTEFTEPQESSQEPRALERLAQRAEGLAGKRLQR